MAHSSTPTHLCDKHTRTLFQNSPRKSVRVCFLVAAASAVFVSATASQHASLRVGNHSYKPNLARLLSNPSCTFYLSLTHTHLASSFPLFPPHPTPNPPTHYSTMSGKGGKSGGDASGSKSTSRSSKAGLQFPVGRIHRLLRKGNYARELVSVS